MLSPDSRPKLALACACLCVAAVVSPALSGDIEYVRNLAYNRGSLTRSALEAALESPTASVKEIGTNIYVSHVSIEVFENDVKATTAQRTVFACCISEFGPALPSGMALIGVSAEYVVLDYQGFPVDGTYSEMSFKRTGTGWDISTDTAGSAVNFPRELPLWAKEELYLASGYMQMNPGQPVVAYNLSESEFAVGTIATLVNFIPGVASTYLGKTTERFIRGYIKGNISGVLDLHDVRWGRGDAVDVEKALDHRHEYEIAGWEFWRNLK